MDRPSVLIDFEVNNVKAVLHRLLEDFKTKNFDHLPDHEKGRLEEELKFFFHELYCCVGCWLVTRNIEDLEGFLNISLYSDDEDEWPDRCKKIDWRLRVLQGFIKTILIDRTVILLPLLGLIGRRKVAAQHFLIHLYKNETGQAEKPSDMPGMPEEYRTEPVWTDIANQLIELGLVEKLPDRDEEEPRWFVLTFQGRAVACNLINREK